MEDKLFQEMQEEAKQYAAEPGRFLFVLVEVLLETEQGKQLVISDGDSICTCHVFAMYGRCPHTLATELLLKDLLTPKEGVYAATTTSALTLA